MSQSARASALRRATRVTVAVLAILAAAGGMQSAGMLAASADPVGLPPVALTQSSTPEEDSITAEWGDYLNGDGIAVADDVTSLTVALPTELAAHFSEGWDYSLQSVKSSESISSGSVEAPSSDAVTVPIPGSLIGFSVVRLSLHSQSPASPAQQVSLYVLLHVHAEQSGTAASIRLEKEAASNWGHHVRSSAAPAGTTVAVGSLITLTSPPGTWTVGPDGDWTDPSPISVGITGNNLQLLAVIKGVASADGSTVTFQVPSASEYAYWPYFPDGATSRAVELSVSFIEGPRVGETIYGGGISIHSTLTLVPAPKPTVDRVGGADRFAVAVAVSKESFPDGAGSAFLVTGANYPDALSAGPAAVHRDAPLLLTRGDSLPPEIATELTRLNVQDVCTWSAASTPSPTPS